MASEEKPTFLVHVANDAEHRRRLGAALRLAARHNAHVTALFIPRPIGMPHQIAGRGAAAGYLAAAAESAQETMAKLREEFTEFCRDQRIDWDWIVEDDDHLDMLSKHSHAADLIIVSQSEQKYFEDRFRFRLPEELVMEAGVPVLLWPRNLEAKLVGNRILIAWKSTREAVRAVRSSIPFLREAEKVVLLSIGPTAEDALSESEVRQYLERHGVNAQTESRAEEGGDVGELILQAAKYEECDLLVMGAYGHPRLRQITFGGVTRHIFFHTGVPVFMTH